VRISHLCTVARNPREMGDILHRTGNNRDIRKPLVSRNFVVPVDGSAHHYMTVYNRERRQREKGWIQRTDRHREKG